jgi:hypothetical protein
MSTLLILLVIALIVTALALWDFNCPKARATRAEQEQKRQPILKAEEAGQAFYTLYCAHRLDEIEIRSREEFTSDTDALEKAGYSSIDEVSDNGLLHLNVNLFIAWVEKNLSDKYKDIVGRLGDEESWFWEAIRHEYSKHLEKVMRDRGYMGNE